MNHALEKLASDLQEVMQKNREMPVSDASDIAAISIPPYVPSDAIKRFDAEQAEYHQRIKDMSFGEIR